MPLQSFSLVIFYQMVGQGPSSSSLSKVRNFNELSSVATFIKTKYKKKVLILEQITLLCIPPQCNATRHPVILPLALSLSLSCNYRMGSFVT